MVRRIGFGLRFIKTRILCSIAKTYYESQKKQYGYEVINVWPHDPGAFTQGIIFHDGFLLESTGGQGESTLRRVDLKTGRVLQQVDVPSLYFAEGLTLFAGKLYQLTWKHRKGFIYDSTTFQKLGEFRYRGEGWGLTNDGESLILSDGTRNIRFLDPVSFDVRRTIEANDSGNPLRQINELQYIKGEIYANIWCEDRIVRIDPRTGNALAWIDLKCLLSANEVNNEDAVLNGIAYDETGDRLFVTGKLWPKLFEIRLTEK